MSTATALHASILDNMDDGVVAVDRRGMITSCNAAAGAILGIPPESCLGRAFAEVFVLAEGLDQFTQAMLDAVNDNELDRRTVEIDVGGERRLLTVSASYLPEATPGDETGADGIVAVFTDISAEMQLRETVESQYAELQQAYRAADEANVELSEALRKGQAVRTAATAAVIALAVGMGLYAWHAGAPDRATAAPAGDTGEAAVFTVSPRRVVAELTVPGRLAPRRETDVQSPVDGTVSAMHFRYGDTVGKGELLLELDASAARRQRRSMRARHIDAERRLEDLEAWESSRPVAAARRSLARVERALQQQRHQLAETEFLRERGIVPRSELDAAQERYESLQLDVEAARHDLAEARRAGDAEALEAARLEFRNLDEELRDLDLAIAGASVRAPVAGVVLRPPADDGGGGPLLKGASVRRGQLLVTVADVSALSVSGLVDEVEVADLQPGQWVAVTADALPGIELAGMVANVAAQARNANGPPGQPALFPIVAALDDIDAGVRGSLRLGMSVDMRVVTTDRDDALLVPIGAVRVGATGATVQVRSQATGEFSTVTVETGSTTPNAVEIVAGVKPGDELLLPAPSSAPDHRP
ncbi:MAG: efflux RND transporter periplasmic adaptor subunit [Gammaproteobacteria bacterium]|nr:efflux RND transporter periplasmic adaptor subunit [Gammaproteobacteria bacterium]MDE0442666.1 efflux RND transporter periplasmic adaptor subunit [Gammaproteobacteria bacterium]